MGQGVASGSNHGVHNNRDTSVTPRMPSTRFSSEVPQLSGARIGQDKQESFNA